MKKILHIISKRNTVLCIAIAFVLAKLGLHDTAFAMILIVASFIDIKTRIVPNWIHIFILTLIGSTTGSLGQRIAGLILIPLPFLIVALIHENGIGGGDIKLVGVCSAYVGVIEGYMASLIGLSFFILWHIPKIIHSDIKEGMPMVPYLATGFLIVFVMK